MSKVDSRQKNNRFFQIFENKHVVLPVIHVGYEEQAVGGRSEGWVAKSRYTLIFFPANYISAINEIL
jgi:hypothetical protein